MKEYCFNNYYQNMQVKKVERKNIYDIILEIKSNFGGIKMSETKWTDEQRLAIEEKGSNILVAAAARQWENSCVS